MCKKVVGRASDPAGSRPKKARKSGPVNDIRLIRPKSRFESARSAWSDISDKTGYKASQVKPKHTKKAWRWLRT